MQIFIKLYTVNKTNCAVEIIVGTHIKLYKAKRWVPGKRHPILVNSNVIKTYGYDIFIELQEFGYVFPGSPRVYLWLEPYICIKILSRQS